LSKALFGQDLVQGVGASSSFLRERELSMFVRIAAISSTTE
jgi:hypothetical protein